MPSYFSCFGNHKPYKSCQAVAFACVIFVVASCRTGYAIPVFARKYSLPCSACHEAWPKLNSFGQNFKDNGYQLMNGKDSPVYQNASFWPVAMRVTPHWHDESSGNVSVDSAHGPVEQTVKTSGFDLTGIDILAAGTISKNISFLLVPSIETDSGSVSFESANVRFDNIRDSTWLNFKFGKAELDLPLSEKRIPTLSNNGGAYQLYHFVPIGDVNATSPADNQLGVELMGHSLDDRTRYAFSVVSSTDGNLGLPAGRSYDVYGHVSHAFEIQGLGLQRAGAYAYYGRQPTVFLTSGGEMIPGSGTGNKSFYRIGFYGNLYWDRFDLTGVFQHASDDVFLGTGTAGDASLPPGARSPAWNTLTVEAHYTYNPQGFFIARYELVRMSQQALADSPSTLGDVDVFTVGCRLYPFINSRAGLAWHTEISTLRSRLTSNTHHDQRNNSIFTGLDFAF